MRLSSRAVVRVFTSKLTRDEIDGFVQRHSTTGRVLDLGARIAPYGKWFPNRVTLDLRATPDVAVVGNGYMLPFPNDTFEAVLCTEVLEHLREPQTALDEMFRVLRTDGRLVLTTRFIFPIHDAPHDYFRFTCYGLEHLLRRFTMVEMREETDSMGALAIIIQRLGFQTALLGSKRLSFLWHVAARLTRRLSWVVTEQYGTSPRERVERNIMTTGYLVACRKP